jgi:hypothetical protein
MDEELRGIPSFQGTNSKMKDYLQELKKQVDYGGEVDSNDINEDGDEDDEFVDPEEFNFLMNMMESEIEGMGSSSGPFSQILQQMGLSLGHPVDHKK